MKKEVWKTIPQAHSLEVSSEGEVRYKPPKVHYLNGYPGVYLRGQRARIHTLVLTAFVGPRPEGYCCHHKNGNRVDNRLENLEWMPTERHILKHVRRGEDHYAAVLTIPKVQQIRRLRKEFGWGDKRIGTYLNLNHYTVRDVLDGETWGWLEKKEDE